MRINVYEEEITNEFKLVWVEPRPGVRFCGVRLFLKSHDDLHHTPEDDDRTAITIWLNNPRRAEKFFTSVIYAIRNEAKLFSHDDE
jgi:diadenosine tetraphosphatase ApaH/serine/threonine PP2A family protein phosphatase